MLSVIKVAICYIYRLILLSCCRRPCFILDQQKLFVSNLLKTQFYCIMCTFLKVFNSIIQYNTITFDLCISMMPNFSTVTPGKGESLSVLNTDCPPCHQSTDAEMGEYTGWAKKSKPDIFCNNFVYCWPISIIFGTYTL